MKYSKELLVAFQNQYKSAFGEVVDLQVAEAELYKLARFVETVTPKVNQENNKAKE